MTKEEIHKFERFFKIIIKKENCNIDYIIHLINKRDIHKDETIKILTKKLKQEDFKNIINNIELKTKDYQIQTLINEFQNFWETI